MISSKREVLLGVLMLSCMRATALGSVPNKPEEGAELKFEVSEEPVSYRSRRRPEDAIWPTHMAQLFMSYRPVPLSRRLDAGHLLGTSAGQTLSKEQRSFMLSDTFSKHAWADDPSRQRSYCCSLYAISQDDARKMAESLVEYVNGFIDSRRRESEELRNKTEAAISETNKLILEKQKLAEAAALNFQAVKNGQRYAFLQDAEAWNEAKATIAELNKTLDVLDIELAGINEKLRTIERYRAKSGEFSKAVHEKLEQMFVEQMVDLAGAEARKRKALEIREQDARFVKLFDEWDHLQFELNNLERKLKDLEGDMPKIEKDLADPRMARPEVYQNEVTIYPVITQQS